MNPRIDFLDPNATLPGGEIRIVGADFLPELGALPGVRMGGISAPLVVGANREVMARVPDGALSGAVEVIDHCGARSNAVPLEVGVAIAEKVHPVCNPALDQKGNIVVTLSGSRGHKTPVSLFKLDADYSLKAWSGAVVNPSGLAYDRTGALFVSSRHDGSIYCMSASGAASAYCEGLGVATGIAFDRQGDLYVGDRSGTIFKIDAHRNTFVFATLEPSIAAYHLAFGPDDFLYVSGPTTSSFDSIWRIGRTGMVETFFRGLGRPQGMAFDADGNLYVAASWRGHRGLVRISAAAEATLVVSAQGLIGLAFAPGPAMILATTNALYHLPWPGPGRPLPPPPSGVDTPNS